MTERRQMPRIKDPPTRWFTTAATPAPPGVIVDFTLSGDTERVHEQAAALLHQFAYPVDEMGHRVPGSDWVDSRVIAGFVDEEGTLRPGREVHSPERHPECRNTACRVVEYEP